MVEWVVTCGRDLVAEEVRLAAKISYLSVGPKIDNPLEAPNPLLFGLLWPVKRSGVSDMAKVLVQGLRDEVRVIRFESLTPFENEFELWGSGAFWAGHQDTTSQRWTYLWIKPDTQTPGFYIAPSRASSQPLVRTRADLIIQRQVIECNYETWN